MLTNQLLVIFGQPIVTNGNMGFLNGDLMEFHGIVMGGSPKVADPCRGVDLAVPPMGKPPKNGKQIGKKHGKSLGHVKTVEHHG